MLADTRCDKMNLHPFPEPVEGLHLLVEGHEKKGRPFDKLREREFAIRSLDSPC